MQPFHLELEEHHRICGCASTTPCGVIPTPPPILQEFTLYPAPLPTPDLAAEEAQASADVAAAQAETAAEQAGEAVRSDDTPARNAHLNDPHAGNLARGRDGEVGRFGSRSPEPGHGDEDEEEEEEARNPHAQEIPRGLQTVRFPVDHGMRNAWFPGRVGGVTVAKRKVLQGLAEREEMMRGSWDRSAPSNIGHEHDGSERQHDENEHENMTIHRRDEAVFSISGIAPDVKLDGKCPSLANDAVGGSHHCSSSSLGSSSSSTPTPRSSTSPTHGISSSSSSTSGAAQPQPQPQSWVYETYDPTRVSAHDLHLHRGPSSSSSSSLQYSIATPNPSCAHCVALAEARRLEKNKADDKTRKALLDRMMRAIPAEGSGSGSSSMAPMDVDSRDGDGDGDVEMEDLDMSGFGFVGDDDDDEEEDEDEDEEEEGDEEDEILVLGDDLPNGQPGFWTSSDRLASPSPERVPRASTSSSSGTTQQPNTATHKQHRDTTTSSKSKRTYVSSTRREFDRARITTSSPCAGIQDIVLSGHTPQQHALWYTGGRGYTFYGRVRPWDGLIGIMRVGANASGAAAGGNGAVGEEGAEGGLLLDTTFIFGYLVGDTTFVGEWRVAGADPLRPAYGGPIVLSRR